MRKEAFGQPGDEDGRPLQPFCGVQGDQCHALCVAIKGILIGHQRGVFHETVEGIEWGKLHEPPRDTAELKKVRPTLLPLNALRGEMRAQARLGIHPVEEFGKCHGSDTVAQSANHVSNARKGVPRACVHARYFATTSGGDDVSEGGSIRRIDARRCGGAQQFNCFVTDTAWRHVENALI